jgi:hypothetical protein
MELFPAADATAWQIIEDVIDASDYYILVVGGRYGSLDEAGLGYTEREYEYAVSRSIPVIPLLHENPDNLPRERTETGQASWEKLKAFRAKVEKRHTCVYWKSAEDLKAKVIISLTAAMKRTPAVGWIRADKVPTEATVTEILALRKDIAELEAQLEAARTLPPIGLGTRATRPLHVGSSVFLMRAQGSDDGLFGLDHLIGGHIDMQLMTFPHLVDEVHLTEPLRPLILDFDFFEQACLGCHCGPDARNDVVSRECFGGLARVCCRHHAPSGE